MVDKLAWERYEFIFDCNWVIGTDLRFGRCCQRSPPTFQHTVLNSVHCSTKLSLDTPCSSPAVS